MRETWSCRALTTGDFATLHAELVTQELGATFMFFQTAVATVMGDTAPAEDTLWSAFPQLQCPCAPYSVTLDLGQRFRDGWAGVASPICRILGSSSATLATMTAVGTIAGYSFLASCILDHFPEIQKVSIGLEQAWKKSRNDFLVGAGALSAPSFPSRRLPSSSQ